jgi:hypothetical protein
MGTFHGRRAASGAGLHPDLTAAERRRLFRRGVELFNRGEHFECHEVFEEIWRSTRPEPRDLFQGLIQVAVGLYHFRARRRPDVARRVLAKGRRRLGRVVDRPHGLDLERLLAEAAAWEAWLGSPAGEPPPLPRLVVRDPDGVR